MTGLSIDGQSLDIQLAWKHNRSLRRLRSTLATRGDNQPVPGVAGRPTQDVIRDEYVVDLELMVFGIQSGVGATHANRIVGLDENLAYLDDWVADHVGPAYTATLETASGSFTSSVQILNWQLAQENATQVVMSYDLRVPSGIWTPVP